MKKFSFYFIFTLLFLLLLLLPIKSDIISEAVRSGITVSFDTLIPTLFPFLFLSNFLCSFGGNVLSSLASPILCPLLGISKNASKAVILGLLGGFPTGSNIAATLYKNGEISKEEAERLPIFSNNAGIMFVLGTLGIAHFSSFKIGVLLYFVHIAASLISGVLTREKKAFPLKNKKTEEAKELSLKSLAPSFSSSVIKSSKSMAVISINFIIFRVFTSLLAPLLPKGNLCAFIGGLFELTGGVLSLEQGFWGLILSAFLLGFNGLSVHMQGYFEFEKVNLSIKRCLKWKLFQGLFSSFLMFIINPSVFPVKLSYPPFIFYLLIFLLPLFLLIPKKVCRKTAH